MKKFLIPAIGILCSVSMMAQDVDITPSNYHFNTAEKIPFYNGTITNVNIANANVNSEFKDDPFAMVKGDYDNGLFVITSGGQGAPQQAAFREAWQLIDFGGDVGQVACFAGKESGIKDVLDDLAPNLSTNWEKIVEDEQDTFQWHLYLMMNPETPYVDNTYIHCRMEYNVYYSNVDTDTDSKYFSQVGMFSNLADIGASWTDSKDIDFSVADCTKDGDNGVKVWDPTKWQVLEFDFVLKGNSDKQINLPYRLRLGTEVGKNMWNNIAFFIKDIKFTQIAGTNNGQSNMKKTEIEHKNVFTATTVATYPGTVTKKENGLTVDFGQTLSEGEGKIVVTLPEGVKEQPEVVDEIDGETLTVTLTGEPGTYTVTIPQGYVNVGDGVNTEIIEEVTINTADQTPEGPETPEAPETPDNVVKFGDITPANYHFNTASVITFYDQMLDKVNILPASGNVFADMNFGEYFDDGLWVLASGGQNNDQQEAFRNGWSLVDLGGDVGQVACFAGKASGLVDQLTALAPDMKDEWAGIAVDDQATAGWQLRLYMDPYNGPSASEGYVHGKVIYNIYTPEPDPESSVFQYFGMSSNAPGKGSDDAYKFGYTQSNALSFPETSCFAEENGVYTWQPNVWQVYEFDFVLPEATETITYTPLALRMFGKANNAWNNYALLIQDITFTGVEGELPAEAPNFKQSTVEYKNVLGLNFESSGVSSLESSDNTPVEYYNLQGVKVAQPAKGVYIRKQGNVTSKVVIR